MSTTPCSSPGEEDHSAHFLTSSGGGQSERVCECVFEGRVGMEVQCESSCSQALSQAQMVGGEVGRSPLQVCGLQNVRTNDSGDVCRIPVAVGNQHGSGQDKMAAGSNVRYYPVKAGLSQLNAYFKGTTAEKLYFSTVCTYQIWGLWCLRLDWDTCLTLPW